ncbi:MAG: hypothetical protein KKI08_07680 [Armatimonadetes bacterium]|nr:hypothetical protein [Armatimonadota bacterium]
MVVQYIKHEWRAAVKVRQFHLTGRSLAEYNYVLFTPSGNTLWTETHAHMPASFASIALAAGALARLPADLQPWVDKQKQRSLVVGSGASHKKPVSRLRRLLAGVAFSLTTGLRHTPQNVVAMWRHYPGRVTLVDGFTQEELTPYERSVAALVDMVNQEFPELLRRTREKAKEEAAQRQKTSKERGSPS